MTGDDDTYQTVTFVPSESNGEVSYVLVVQDEKQGGVVNIDLKVDQTRENVKTEAEEKGNDDVYNFDEEEAGEEEEDEEVEEMADGTKPKVSLKNRAKQMRPNFTCNFCAYTSHRR